LYTSATRFQSPIPNPLLRPPVFVLRPSALWPFLSAVTAAAFRPQKPAQSHLKDFILKAMFEILFIASAPIVAFDEKHPIVVDLQYLLPIHQ
jgi:hypothetical protein